MLVGNRRSTARAEVPSQRVTVSLYEKPPREEMTLEEFEVFAVDRLKVLRTIDALRQKGFKPKELEAELAPVVRELLPLASAGPQAPSDARKDSVSHFILRLAYSRSEELRRWFLTQECALFRHRLSRLRGDGFARFLREHGLKFEEVPDSERDARVTSLARIKNYENVPAQTATYYRVPFLEAIDLIGRREVYLEKGYAYVPQAKLHSIVVSRFRASLSRSLAKASGSLAAAAADPRLGPLLTNVEKHDLERTDVDDDDVEGITPEQIDALADQSMPLCMQQLHYALKRDHKLKHWGRQQYGLFLKAAGLSMEDQLRFFQAEFTKIMTHDQFSKEYAYNIRHRYGKEGKRTEYSPYGCYKLVMDMAPGPGEYHGCPYRHFDADHLAAVLSKTSLDAGEQSLVLGKAKERNYQIACQRHFEFAHKKQTVACCVENKFRGASPPMLNHNLHAIDATPARWRGHVGSSPLDGAGTATPSPRNDLVKNYRHPTHWLISTQVNGKKVVANMDGVGNHPNAWFKASRVYHQDLHAAEHPEEAKAKEEERAKGIAAANQSQVEGMVLAN
jgi:DNA primase large subunit